MPRTLSDIFNENPGIEVIVVLGYDDGEPFGLSPEGLKLKIYDFNFADQLARLPGANTENGHVTNEGYFIRGGYNFRHDAPMSYVYRQPPKT